jgi:hypothetical protein
LDFVCVLKTGGAYSVTHVEALRDLLLRFNPDARLYCLTDERRPIEGVISQPLRHDLPGWFSKLEIFELDLHSFIYVDLDVIITGPISLHIPSGLWLLRGFKGHGVNSSVMLVNGHFASLTQDFLQNRDQAIRDYTTAGRGWGDQDFIRDSGLMSGFIQDCCPGLAGSWRQSLNYRMGVIDDAPSILVFHGQPKPEQVRFQVLGPHRIRLFAFRYLPQFLFYRFRRRSVGA